MKKNILSGLLLLTTTGLAHSAAILVTPTNPLTIVINGSSESLDINGDGVNDFLFTSTYTNDPFSNSSGSGTNIEYYQGTTETTEMQLTSLSGFVSNYAVPFNWLTSTSDLSPINNPSIYSRFYESVEICNYNYLICDYYDSVISGGIMEFDISGYIGFNFDISGDTHWGWMFADRSGGTLKINSWGWESEANTLINAGAGISAVPVPAAAWLFGSGLLGLFGLARMKTNT